MTVQQMKQLLKDFGKTLNDKDKDEWWDTPKNVWNDFAKDFLMWCNSHRDKLQGNKPEGE